MHAVVGHRIVVTEATPRWSLVLAATLGPRGYAVEPTTGLVGASAAIQRGPVAAVVIDDQLADGDPFEICGQAKVDGAEPFVLLVSAMRTAAGRVRAIRCGADEHLGKPALTSEVLSYLEMGLRRRERRTGAIAPLSVASEYSDAAHDLVLLDALELLLASNAQGSLEVFGPDDRRGRIVVQGAAVVDALAGRLEGQEALQRLFRWRGVRIGRLLPGTGGQRLSLTSQDLGPAFFEARTAWRTHTSLLPALDRRLQVQTEVVARRLGDWPMEQAALLRQFDGRQNLQEIIDGSDLSDEDSCRVISQWIAGELLVQTGEMRRAPSGVFSGELTVLDRAMSPNGQRTTGQSDTAAAASITLSGGHFESAPLPTLTVHRTGARAPFVIAEGELRPQPRTIHADPAMQPPGRAPSAASKNVDAADRSPSRRPKTANRARPRSGRLAAVRVSVGAALGVAGALFLFARAERPSKPLFDLGAHAMVDRRAPRPAAVSAGAAPRAGASSGSAARSPAPTVLGNLPLEPAAASANSPAAEAPAPAPDSAEQAEAQVAACRRTYIARQSNWRVVKLCTQAAMVAPDQADVMAMLAHAELDRGNYRRARSWARKAISLNSEVAEAYAFLGFVEEELGRREPALKAYSSYLRLAPFGRFAQDIRLIVNEAE
jgi:DNA-binding response OmpR family regulator